MVRFFMVKKHIDIRIYFLGNLVKGVVELTYCNSQEWVAVMMKKPVKLDQYLKFYRMMEIVEPFKIK